MSSEAVQISDNRIAEINKLYDRFRLWGNETSGVGGPDAADVVRQIWALEDKEGYWSEYVIPSMRSPQMLIVTKQTRTTSE